MTLQRAVLPPDSSIESPLPASGVPEVLGLESGPGGSRRLADAAAYRGHVHPDDWDTLVALVDVSDRYPASSAIIRVGQSPNWRLVEHRVGVDERGEPMVSTQDVTDREQALQRASRTDRYWRTLLRNGHEAIAVLEPGSLKVREGNDALAALVGHALDQVIGRGLANHVVAEHRHRMHDLVTSLPPGGSGACEVRLVGDPGPITASWTATAPNADPVWAEVVVTNASDDPDVGAHVANMRDISDRKASEERLRSSERLFRSLSEHLADGAVVVDPAGSVTHASKRAERLLGGNRPLCGRPLPFEWSHGDGPGEVALDGRWFELTSHDLTQDPVVRGTLVIIRDVTARRAADDQLRRAATIDPLTGIANRRGFEDQLAALGGATRGVGLGFLDLDGFKAVNDDLGHDAGDQLLVEVARRIESAIRPGDEVARFGGDEFVVTFTGLTDETTLAEVTQRVVDAVGGTYELGETTVSIGVSAGWSLVIEGDIDEALRRADQHMYTHKRRSRRAA